MSLSPNDVKVIRDIVKEGIQDNNRKIEDMLKQLRSDFFDKIDPILKEVLISRDERTVMSD